MNFPGDALARPPVRSKRARIRGRRRARLVSPPGSAPQPGAVAPTGAPLGARAPEPAGVPFDAFPPPVPTAAVPDQASDLAPVGSAPPPPPPFEPVGDPFVPAPASGAVRREAGATLTLEAAGEMPVRVEGASVDDTPPGARRRHSSLRNGVEWVLIIAAALLAALLIKTYLLQAFYIPSASMEPTLEIQDRVLVNKLSYRLHDVNRGDVVVFERPPNDVGQIRDLIKRVIALSGETVEARDGTVYVDGRPLREPYLPAGTVTTQFGPKTIPEGFIWVMGDNRSNSSDSRVFGAVDEHRIIGRAFVRVWPVTALSLL